MKNLLKLLPVVVFAILITSSCKKPVAKGTADPNASQHNQDVQNTKSESDNSNTDINTAISSTSGFGKNSAVEANSICGGTIDYSQVSASPPTITITFDGQTVCPSPNRIRSGTVKVQLVAGTHWTDVGAQVLVTYTNYKVIFQSLNNAFITFNGTKYLTDVNGIGANVLNGTPVVIRERTYNMTVTFENGATSSWNDARLSSWVLDLTGNISATVNGDTTINGKTIDSWGQTRWGTNFTTEMVVPWKSGTLCGWWAPTQGEYTSTTTNFTVTATLGLNGNGNAVTSGCATNFELAWTLTASNTSGSILLSYF
jgi:hypothetical protein